MTDIISRQDVIKTVIRMCSPICDWELEKKAYTDCVVAEINSLPSAKPIHTRNCDGCDIFTMAEELAKASIDACADEIVRQIKDSRVECKDCKHHHTSEMYEYCDLIAVKGRRQRVMKYCSLGERR